MVAKQVRLATIFVYYFWVTDLRFSGYSLHAKIKQKENKSITLAEQTINLSNLFVIDFTSVVEFADWIQKKIFRHSGLERSQQLRGDRSRAVAIVDCWLWRMMTENLFSRTFIWQRQWFATANNSHTQISRPKRYRLTEPPNTTKKRE